tara:strand:+ start:1843 stop:2196 length:354 start_codon:yes stop_codon:yes gene_type:complete
MGFKNKLKAKEETGYYVMVHAFEEALGLKDLDDMERQGMKSKTKDSLRDAKEQIKKNAKLMADAVAMYIVSMTVPAAVTVGPDATLDLDEAVAKSDVKSVVVDKYHGDEVLERAFDS